MTAAIDQFAGRYRFLSNFWPCIVMLDGYRYPSVEHAYQAAKFPPEAREPFRNPELRAGAAKRMGRGKGGKDWHSHSLSIMADLLWQKFEGPRLKAQLLATGDADLIEGNDWGDTFFGAVNGVGENHLGRMLMEVRKGLRDGWRPHE